MWQIGVSIVFFIEYWYLLASVAAFIIFVLMFNIMRRKKRLKIHQEFLKKGKLTAAICMYPYSVFTTLRVR
ncbi:hypothetical protein PAECIP111802_02613 [Paenibacillus allorhizosphaerae]|uniref:Uncharacterized protein n=1 Tax=Paenibacillus allorhizosphaerae TaxID=2849866 RepID=A0ABM8VGY8_9BACL|nr:hypothetical protein PAECIP111802_02613 [Paenibacillus allorhizosphaerae]